MKIIVDAMGGDQAPSEIVKGAIDASIENDDLDEGIIVQEIQSGYMLHDRLLRPAMVGVSKKSSKESKDDVKAKPESENN